MAYIGNDTITVDAILTNAGRRILSEGQEGFKITKFALSDDEIDYGLWNENHSLGSNYYGIAIESLPILEAIPREVDMLRYKLITMPRGTRYIPSIDLGVSSITLVGGQTYSITPSLINNSYAGNVTMGYTATISDKSVCTIRVKESVSGGVPIVNDVISVAEGSTNSISVVGRSFDIIANNVSVVSTCKLTITGNETGGYAQINITVNPNPLYIPSTQAG